MSKRYEQPRPEHWPSLLAEFINYSLNRPFAYGVHDCALFAADWVEACLGEDPAEPWRSSYTDEAGALKILKKHKGVRMLADTCFKRVRIHFAKRGDLVAYQDPEIKGPAWMRTALGILDGPHGLFVGKQGLYRVKRAELMKTAWRVGVA